MLVIIGQWHCRVLNLQLTVDVSPELFLGCSVCADYSVCNHSITFVWCANSSVILLRDFKLILLSAALIFIYGQLKPVLMDVGECHQTFAWVSLASMSSCVYFGEWWEYIQVSKKNSPWLTHFHGHLLKVAVF